MFWVIDWFLTIYLNDPTVYHLDQLFVDSSILLVVYIVLYLHLFKNIKKKKKLYTVIDINYLMSKYQFSIIFFNF
jgi:GT2 family glycosyltransferase